MSFLDLETEVAFLGSGIELAFVREGAGPCLIFVHGAMGDWRVWAPQWPAFVPEFSCISYSRRYSSPNPNELRSRDHNALVDAADLLGLMDALELDRAILVGSSYGGFAALATAMQAPERIKALVSVEAPMMRYALASRDGEDAAKAFLESSARPAREAFERGDDELGTRILTGGIVGQAPASIPEVVIESRMRNVRAARSLALSDDEFPWLDPAALAALPMPVLLMSGANTAPVHAAIFRAVRAAMPQASVRIVEGSGHSVSQERPDEFNREAISFLKANGLVSLKSAA